jgi:L-malate glycosyltransferase
VREGGLSTPIGVLYVIGSFRFGGSERHVLQLVRHLDPLRFRASLAVVNPGGELEPAFRETGIPIQVLGINRLLSPGALRSFREVGAFAASNNVRIVHGFNFHGNLYGAIIASPRSGRVLVTSERGIVENLRVHHQWARRYYHRRSRRMLVNSEEVRQYVQQIPDGRPGWLQVVHNGVDTTQVDRSRTTAVDRGVFGVPAECVLIGHVGRFREEKGQVFMLSAFREVAEQAPEARFLLVGGGPDSEILAAEIARPPLAGKATLLGYQEDVRPFLGGMDIFVLPSRTEGMPNALLEALAMAVPCVSTRVGGTEELLDGGRVGRLVDYGDRAALVRALLGLVRDRGERTRLGQASRRRAVEHFSMAAMIGTYQQAYADVLGSAATREEPCP